MQHHHSQGFLAVELVAPAFDELPGELDIQSSPDSGWITISYQKQTIARYLPVHEIAELDVHLVVNEFPNDDSESDEITGRLMEALSALQDHGFTICHEYAEDFGNERFRQSLVLRNCPVTEEQVVELVQATLDASRYAIDVTVDQNTVEMSSD